MKTNVPLKELIKRRNQSVSMAEYDEYTPEINRLIKVNNANVRNLKEDSK